MEEAEEVVRNYSRAGIPLDTMWTDIDYMDGNRDFSLDPVRYAEPKMKVRSGLLVLQMQAPAMPCLAGAMQRPVVASNGDRLCHTTVQWCGGER